MGRLNHNYDEKLVELIKCHTHAELCDPEEVVYKERDAQEMCIEGTVVFGKNLIDYIHERLIEVDLGLSKENIEKLDKLFKEIKEEI